MIVINFQITMQETKQLSGFLLINKPKNITSYACVAKIKKLLGKKAKIGHAGTLDLLASGLLIIGIDRAATRYLADVMKLDKVYVATGKLGELTSSLDYESEVLETCQKEVTQKDIIHAIQQLGSAYEQIPPIYSALKHEGKPLYQLVRKGRVSQAELEDVVTQKSRVIQLYNVELINYEFPYFTIRAHVSHGTYIRTLVNDIARKAGSCATTYNLERSAIGPFKLENATTLDQLTTIEIIENHIIPVEQMLSLLEHYAYLKFGAQT